MRLTWALLLLAILLGPSLATAQWTNEPAGSTAIIDCPMVSTSACGLLDVYTSLVSGSESVTGMVSPPSILSSILYAGNGNGGSQIEKYFSSSYNEVYFGIVLRTSAIFENWACCANKMFFLRGSGTNGFFGLNKGSGSATLYFGHNTGIVNGVQLDNSHICAADYGLGGCQQNVDTTPLIHGQWTKLEVYMKASTSAISRDGILRMWKNGSKIMEYATLNYPNGFSNWIWTETIFNLPPLSNNKEWAFDQIRLSIPDCGVAGCGGGGGDTTPPSQVTGLGVSMNGTTATITWSAASDNIGVTGYLVDKCTPGGCSNWALDQSVSGLSATVGSLTAGVSYSFRVRATDAAGNLGPYSATGTGTTTADVPRTLATDTFNRANGVLGTNWTGSYSTMGDLTIVSNAARATGSNDAAMFYNALSAQTDQWAMVDITAATGTQAYAGGVTLHAATPPTPTFYTCRLLGNGWTGAIMDKFVNNAYTLLGSNSGATWAAGDQLKCTIRGSALTMTRIRSGVETVIITATDSGITSGNAGILIYSPTAANMIVDNFTVGDWTAAAAAPTISNFTADATGGNVTWTGDPAYIRVQTYTVSGIYSDVVEPIANFPAGRYSQVWAIGITSGCLFAQDSNHVENTNPGAYRCNTITPNPPADTTPPVISNPLPTGVLVQGTTSTAISVSTNETASCKWNTSDVAYDSMANTFSTANGMIHSGTKTGLSNGTSYTLYVRCRDAVTNVNLTSSTITFSVDSAPAADSTVPSTVTGLSCVALSTTQIQCSWTAATDNVAVAGYRLYASVGTGTTAYALAASPSSTSATLTGLVSATVYALVVDAVDTSNNVSAAHSSAVEVTTAQNLDVVPPSTLMNMQESTPATYSTVSLAWDDGTDNVAISQSIIERCAGETCTDFQTIRSPLRTSLSDSSVKFGTTYRYRGKFRDTSNNVSTDYSEILTVVVPNPPIGTTAGVCPCKTH